MMGTKIIFDASTEPFVWSHVWAAGGALVFGCVIVALKKSGWRHALSAKWGYFMIVAALVTSCYDSGHWYILRRWAGKILDSGEYAVLEGPVKDFHPMPDDGSSNESFSIAGRTFSYSDEEPTLTTVCFNQTSPHGGPIHDSMWLRVKFVDNCILEIETADANARGQLSSHSGK
jgi:hypothetical protein